jgi:hypothetical protein
MASVIHRGGARPRAVPEAGLDAPLARAYP